MQIKRSHGVVAVLMIVAVLFGCQCGTVPKPDPNNPNNPNAPGGQGGGDVKGDPAEQAAIDLVKKHGGSVSQEGGRVVVVSLFKDSFNDDDLKKLPSLTKVRKMGLNGTKITGAGFKDLVGFDDLADLQIGSPFNDAGMKEITRFKNLKVLSVGSREITEAGLRELAHLKKLEELYTQGSGISNTGATFIGQNLHQLKKLDLGNSGLGDVGLAAIVEMPNLRELTIYGTDVSDKGVALLPKLKTLEDLKLGNLRGNGDEALKSVAKCANLRAFFISNSNVTDKGFRELWNMPNLKDVTIRNAVFGKVTNEAVAEFIKTHPNCRITGP